MAKANKAKAEAEVIDPEETVQSGSKKLRYEEWRCEIKGGKLQKLLKLRDNVKLSEFHAETINRAFKKIVDGEEVGWLDNPHAILYFQPEN